VIIRRSFRLLLLALTLGLAACTGPSTGGVGAVRPSATTASREVVVDIKLFTYKPSPLEAPVGSRITWTNHDDIEHSVTAGTPAAPGGAFDSDFFTPNQSFAFTFNQPGDFLYFCKRHNGMQGLIKIAAP
jgi:plastocyanin